MQTTSDQITRIEAQAKRLAEKLHALQLDNQRLQQVNKNLRRDLATAQRRVANPDNHTQPETSPEQPERNDRLRARVEEQLEALDACLVALEQL